MAVILAAVVVVVAAAVVAASVTVVVHVVSVTSLFCYLCCKKLYALCLIGAAKSPTLN